MSDFKLKNKWDIPSQSLPIIFIGAGGIIRNAHIPAYKKLNLNIAGVYDLNPETLRPQFKYLIGHFLHGVKLKSYNFDKYKTNKKKEVISINIYGKSIRAKDQIKFRSIEKG